MTSESIKMLATQDPIETLSTATTCIKGYSRCRYCGASGNFSIYRGQEWAHNKNCPWIEATELHRTEKEQNQERAFSNE